MRVVLSLENPRQPPLKSSILHPKTIRSIHYLHEFTLSSTPLTYYHISYKIYLVLAPLLGLLPEQTLVFVGFSGLPLFEVFSQFLEDGTFVWFHFDVVSALLAGGKLSTDDGCTLLEISNSPWMGRELGSAASRKDAMVSLRESLFLDEIDEHYVMFVKILVRGVFLVIELGLRLALMLVQITSDRMATLKIRPVIIALFQRRTECKVKCLRKHWVLKAAVRSGCGKGDSDIPFQVFEEFPQKTDDVPSMVTGVDDSLFNVDFDVEDVEALDDSSVTICDGKILKVYLDRFEGADFIHRQMHKAVIYLLMLRRVTICVLQSKDGINEVGLEQQRYVVGVFDDTQTPDNWVWLRDAVLIVALQGQLDANRELKGSLYGAYKFFNMQQLMEVSIQGGFGAKGRFARQLFDNLSLRKYAYGFFHVENDDLKMNILIGLIHNQGPARGSCCSKIDGRPDVVLVEKERGCDGDNVMIITEGNGPNWLMACNAFVAGNGSEAAGYTSYVMCILIVCWIKDVCFGAADMSCIMGDLNMCMLLAGFGETDGVFTGNAQTQNLSDCNGFKPKQVARQLGCEPGGHSEVTLLTLICVNYVNLQMLRLVSRSDQGRTWIAVWKENCWQEIWWMVSELKCRSFYSANQGANSMGCGNCWVGAVLLRSRGGGPGYHLIFVFQLTFDFKKWSLMVGQRLRLGRALTFWVGKTDGEDCYELCGWCHDMPNSGKFATTGTTHSELDSDSRIDGKDNVSGLDDGWCLPGQVWQVMAFGPGALGIEHVIVTIGVDREATHTAPVKA